MKHETVTKLDKRNTAASKNDVMATNCDVIFKILSYHQFEVIQIPDSGGMIFSMVFFDASVKLTFSFSVTFYLIKTENQIKESPTQHSHYCFE